jgi:hypothetical protein
VDNHRIDADVLHQDDVEGEAALFSVLVDHGVAAVLDHHCFFSEFAHIRQ